MRLVASLGVLLAAIAALVDAMGQNAPVVPFQASLANYGGAPLRGVFAIAFVI